MAELIAEAFTNEFGQVIQPGDDVVYVGTGYAHNVSVNKGKFAGVYYAERRHYLKDEAGKNIYDNKSQAKYEMRKYVKAVRVDGIPSKRYDYKTRKFDETIRCAILPLKRVYKIDTSMQEFAGKSF